MPSCCRPSTLPTAGTLCWSTVLIALLGLAPAAQAECADVLPVDLLPADGSCAWSRDGVAQTAYTLEELAEIINGGAFLFYDYGFIAAAFQNYAGEIGGDPSALTLGLYNQGSGANAAALYADPESGSGEPVPGWEGSGEARYTAAFGFLTLQFHEACFFGSLTFTAGGEAALPHAVCLAQAVVAAIQQATPAKPQHWGTIKAAYR